MKKISLLAFIPFILLLAGCATRYPDNADLKLQVGSKPFGVYGPGTTATLRGRDARDYPEVIVYQIGGKPAVKLENLAAPHITVSEQFAAGLTQQGLVFDSSSPVRIELTVNDLRAVVNRPNMLYTTEAISRISLNIENNGTNLTKKYKREAKRESLTRPELGELESLLSGQLSDIVEQMLNDEEVRNVIKKKP